MGRRRRTSRMGWQGTCKARKLGSQICKDACVRASCSDPCFRLFSRSPFFPFSFFAVLLFFFALWVPATRRTAICSRASTCTPPCCSIVVRNVFRTARRGRPITCKMCTVQKGPRRKKRWQLDHALGEPRCRRSRPSRRCRGRLQEGREAVAKVAAALDDALDDLVQALATALGVAHKVLGACVLHGAAHT